MVARFWDIFTDPLMGALVDRYPSKWGRRKTLDSYWYSNFNVSFLVCFHSF